MGKAIPAVRFWTKYDTKLFQLISVIEYFVMDEW